MRSIVGIIFLVCCSFIWQSSHPKNVKVILHLDDYLCSEEQWVYMHGFKSWVSGNEFIIFDSVKIDKGQNRVELHSYIPYEMTHRLFFTKIGPQNLYFVVEPNKEFSIDIGIEDGESGGTKLITGGSANNEDVLFYKNKINIFKEKITKLSQENPFPSDSIDHYNSQIAYSYIDFIKSTSHPENAGSAFLMLRTYYNELIGYDKIEELKLFLQNKFYDYRPISDLNLKGSEHAPPSEESKVFSARFEEIRKGREFVDPPDTIIGAQVSLSLPNMEGQYISTDSLTGDYLLIDFWASWCAPCRKESPYLKEALSKYDSSFSIYAVTLDSDLNACMQAIEKDGTEEFIHVKGILGGNFPCYAVRKLGVREIPANFLLDKERRIVAKNLRGEELLNMLEQLTEKK